MSRLKKKLKQIETLEERQVKGEKLEENQVHCIYNYIIDIIYLKPTINSVFKFSCKPKNRYK